MRRLFPLVATVILVDTMFYAAIAPLLPSYEAELGLSKAAAGVLTASYAAGTLLASVPAGYLAARRGPRAAVLLGLVLLSGSSLAFAFAPNVVLLDLARFVQGVGGACSWAGGLAWVMRAAGPGARGGVVGAVMAAAVGGVALGPVLGATAQVTSPELVFSAVAVLAAALAGWAALTPGLPGSVPPPLAELGRAITRGPVLASFALVGLPALFSGTLAVLAPLRLDDLGASGIAIGAIFLVAALLEAAISPLIGRVSDRRGRRVPLRAGLAAAVPAAVVLALGGGVGVVAVAVVATVAVLAVFWAPAMALASDAAEATGLDQGFAGGIVNLAWAGGQVVGGTGGAALAQATSDAVPYTALALLSAVALVGVARSRSGAGGPSAGVGAAR